MSFYTDEGLRRSQRIADKISNQATAVEGTLEDLMTVIPGPSGGKRRGGEKSQTRAAIEELFAQMEANKNAMKAGADVVIATAIRSVPYVVGTVAAVKTVQNVSVLGKVASMIRDALGVGVVVMSRHEPAPYKMILTHVVSALKTTGLIGRDMFAYVQNSPEAAVALAAIIISVRALNSKKSIKQIIMDDAAAVTAAGASMAGMASAAAASAVSVGSRAVTGEIQKFNDAWNAEAAKTATYTLRSIGARAGKLEGMAPAEVRAMLAADPSYGGPLPDGEEGMGVQRGLVPPGPPGKAVKGRFGGRHRKTKKPYSKKRRVTRRKPTFAY